MEVTAQEIPDDSGFLNFQETRSGFWDDSGVESGDGMAADETI
jgi:hypothetical protein